MSEENTEKLVVVLTHGVDNQERASLAFVMANSALAMDVETKVILQGEGVMLGVKGMARYANAPGFSSISDLLKSYIELGGKMYLCTPCCNGRGIKKEDLLEAASMVSGGFVIDESTSASAVLCY